ncbi:hypothetical protein H5T58_02310, partial [Candidatus Parcubacteria bacterium]|nr:hypothetical protein [Candidatus Parcubacteria bacterium]
MKQNRKNILLILFSIVVLSSLIGGSIGFLLPQKRASSNLLSQNTVTGTILEGVNKILSAQGEKAEILETNEESGLYRLKLKLTTSNQEIEIFATKDGKYVFPYAIDLTQVPSTSPQPQKPADVEKRERPDVKLFVMSYCPFGLQMQKALLPVWELLKGKADIGVYFVSYLMHGRKEMEENLRQYCIQKEQANKYLAYLNCFVKEGKSEQCLTEAKIDLATLKTCETNTDKEFKISENFKEEGYPPFDVHKDLNEKYGVRGSPTLIINDVEVSVERSPEKVKEAICNAFLNPPP